MMMKKTGFSKITIGVLSIFSLSLITSCGAIKYNTLEDVIHNKTLSISINAEFAPFEYYERGKIVGFDIDLINEYCKYLDVRADINDMDFDAMLLFTYKGKSDCAISGITKNSKREEVFTFSDPYFQSNQVVVVAKNSEYFPLSNKDDVLNRLSEKRARIGCQRGTTSEYYILGTGDERMRGIPNTTCVPFDTVVMAIKDLNEGRLDAVIGDDVPLNYILSSYEKLAIIPNISLLDENLCVAFGKNNFTLVDSFNTFLANNQELIDNLKKKFFGGNYEKTKI